MTSGPPPLSPEAARLLRAAAGLLGALLLVLVLAGELRGGDGLGRIQMLLLVAGVLLLLAALLGRRLPGVWRAGGLVLLNTLLVALALELASALVLTVLPRRSPALDWRRQYEAAPWFSGRDWAAAFWREHWAAADARRYEPFTLWRSAPFGGRYVNVDSLGFRHTPGAECPPGKRRIMLFGGSTVWGWLAHDSGTIASYLQRELDARGIRACVENLGQLGYVSTQERIELERQLEAGRVPDVALFYSGWNDCDVAASNGQAGRHKDFPAFAAGVNAIGQSAPAHPLAPLRRLSMVRLARRLVPARAPAPVPRLTQDTASLATAIAGTWLANAAMIDALARQFGFDYRIVLQPWLRVGRRELTGPERAITPATSSALCAAAYQRMAAGREALPRIVDLRQVFDTVTATVYLDEMHVTADANAVVARRLAELVAPAIGTARNLP